MYIFGGYKCTEAELYEYRFGARTWSVVKTTGQPPSPRWGHRAVLFKAPLYLLLVQQHDYFSFQLYQ
jgi:hypothetical protein